MVRLVVVIVVLGARKMGRSLGGEGRCGDEGLYERFRVSLTTTQDAMMGDWVVIRGAIGNFERVRRYIFIIERMR